MKAYHSVMPAAVTRRPLADMKKGAGPKPTAPVTTGIDKESPGAGTPGLPTVLGCGRTDCRGGAAMPGTCHECKRPLIVIDNRGENLVGCLSCNLWCDRDGNAVRLSEEDLAALHALRR
jgi:hypothetical protein